MRPLLLALTLSLGSLTLYGQAPDCQFTQTFTATGYGVTTSNRAVSNTGTQCTTWRLSYYAVGLSALSIQVEGAPDAGGIAGTFAAVPNSLCSSTQQPACLIDGSNPLTDASNNTMAFRGYYGWLALHVTVFTGTGTITARMYGYKGSSASASATRSGQEISACTTDPPTTGAANSFCSTSTGLYQCQNGSSACTTAGQWVLTGPGPWQRSVGGVISPTVPTDSVAIGNTLLLSLACDGITDMIAGIQAALDKTGIQHVVVQSSSGSTGACAVSVAPQVHSGQHLELAPNVTISFTSGATGNILINSGTTPQRTLTGCATTINSTNLICSGGSFTGADVGRTVNIPGARSSVYMLVANIVTVWGGTNVVLSVAATRAVSGVFVPIYTRDSNVEVSGGHWLRGNGGAGTGLGVHVMWFRHVDGLYIHDLSVAGGVDGKFAISAGDVTNFKAEHINFPNNGSDGVHTDGPAQGVTYRDISGSTGDDSATVSCGEGTYSVSDVAGDIQNVLMDNLNTTSGTNIARVIGGTGMSVSGVVIRNVYGTPAYSGVAVSDDTLIGATAVHGLLIDGVFVNPPPTGTSVSLAATLGDDADVRNVTVYPATGRLIGIEIAGNWNSVGLSVNGSGIGGSGASLLVLETSVGTIGSLRIHDFSLTCTDTAYSVLWRPLSGVVTNAIISGGSLKQCRSLMDFPANSATQGPVFVSDVTLNGTGRMSNAYRAVDVTVTNTVINTINTAIYDPSGGNVIVRGFGVTGKSGWGGFSVGGAGIATSYNPDWVVDVQTMTAVNGGKAYNSNASSACGIGPIISDGSAWKNLYSGIPCT